MQILSFNVAGPRVIKDTPSPSDESMISFLCSFPRFLSAGESLNSSLTSQTLLRLSPSITSYSALQPYQLSDRIIWDIAWAATLLYSDINGTYSHIRDLHYAWSERYVTWKQHTLKHSCSSSITSARVHKLYIDRFPKSLHWNTTFSSKATSPVPGYSSCLLIPFAFDGWNLSDISRLGEEEVFCSLRFEITVSLHFWLSNQTKLLAGIARCHNSEVKCCLSVEYHCFPKAPVWEPLSEPRISFQLVK